MDILQVLVPIAYAGIILIATWVTAKFITTAIRRIVGRSTQLFGAQIQRLVWLLIWLIGLILAVEEIGVNPDILLLMVGLMGIAAIVALRGPLENFGARYFTHGYIPLKVGDSITVQNHSGKIIEINAMSTILLSNDHIISIPNNTFVKETIINTTHQAWKTVTVPIIVNNNVDLPAFESSVLKSINKLRSHFDDRFPPILSVVSRSRQATELSLTVMIRSPDKRDAIINEVNKRVAELVDEAKKSKKQKA
ncbi:MAG: mechanosensitive ion channel family protein [Candidatus Marsarchaeota archaeon]|nr:mechanosensitive ion channel family protein [Candidatus Marsarchaeota archaeon]